MKQWVPVLILFNSWHHVTQGQIKQWTLWQPPLDDSAPPALLSAPGTRLLSEHKGLTVNRCHYAAGGLDGEHSPSAARPADCSPNTHRGVDRVTHRSSDRGSNRDADSGLHHQQLYRFAYVHDTLSLLLSLFFIINVTLSYIRIMTLPFKLTIILLLKVVYCIDVTKPIENQSVWENKVLIGK